MYSVGKPAYRQVAIPLSTGVIVLLIASLAITKALESRKAKNGRNCNVVAE